MKIVTIMAVAAAAMLTVASPASARNHHYKHYAQHHQHHKLMRAVRQEQTVSSAYCPGSEMHCNAANVRQQAASPGSGGGGVRKTASRGVCAGCVVVSTAANIDITVHSSAASKYQALISDFVAQGYHPKSIVCFAYGHKPGSNHAIGMACDFDQKRWGVTARPMYHATATINREGLFDGGAFGDWGHVEAVRGLHNHPPNLYASMQKFQSSRDFQP